MKTRSDGVDRARRQSKQRSLQILTDYGFAAWWLMPRLPELNAILPSMEVRISTTQVDVDATGADFDLALMFGKGDWAGYRSTPIFPEEVYPVCSPVYLGGRPAPLRAEEIARMRLLHLRAPAKGRWFTWADWLNARGLAVEDGQEGLAFDNFQLVLQAALLGQGVCIGWTPLIDDLVAGGGLVRLTPEPLRSVRGYHVVEHLDRPARVEVARLKEWLFAGRRAVAAPHQNFPSLPLAAA